MSKTSSSAVINLLEYSGRPWSEIKFPRDPEINSTAVAKPSASTGTIDLLPRKDYSLYGEFPKLERKLLVECNKCSRVLLPCVIKAHCRNVEHHEFKVPTIPPKPKVKRRSSSSSRSKKSPSKRPNSHSTDNGTSEKSSPETLPVWINHTISAPTAVVASSSHSNNSSHSNHSRHRSRVKSNRGNKEDSDRSEKGSNAASRQVEGLQPSETTDVIKSETISNELHSNHLLTIKEEPNVGHSSKSSSRTILINNIKAESSDKKNNVKLVSGPSHKIAKISKSQGIVKSSSASRKPMVPATVFNILPVQKFASSQQPASLSTQSIVVALPCQKTSHELYTSHPKPLTMITRSIRKIGNTFLLQNQRLEHQRADMRTYTNSFQHRPNILRNSARNNVKVTVKHNSDEKSGNEDIKQARLEEILALFKA